MGMAGSLIEAPCRLFGRVGAPAVLVALATGRPGQISELLGKAALARLLAASGERVALAAQGQPAVDHEAVEVRGQRLGWNGEEARKLTRPRSVREPLGAHPVHRLQHLVA